METQIQHSQISPSSEEQLRFRLWLQVQFTDRCKRNARYSLRAFAKYLKQDPSTLSQILSSKRAPSKKRMLAICGKLSATPIELGNFGLLAKPAPVEANFMQMELDVFAIVADWYHSAIMELTYVDGFRNDPKWIARKLSLTIGEVTAAIERLLRTGLLMESDGSLKKVTKHLTNLSAVTTSSAHREFQRQIIQKASMAIDNCQQEEKSITSMTMAIDVKNLDFANEKINSFRRELCSSLEDGNPTRVYNLAIQLFPVSGLDNEI